LQKQSKLYNIFTNRGCAHMTSPSTEVGHQLMGKKIDWQHWFWRECRKHPQNTSRTGKSFAIDCSNRFDKKSDVFFTDCRKLQKREAMVRCNSKKHPWRQNLAHKNVRKHDFWLHVKIHGSLDLW